MDPSIDPALIVEYLPPAWLDAVHAWAPYVLAIIVAATALVRVAIPAAKRLEAWTLTTPAGWDDSAARYLVRALEWLASVSAWLLAWVPRLTVGPPAPKPQGGTSRRRSTPPTLPVLCLVLADVLLVGGCGSELDVHAAIARSALETQIASEPVIRDLRVAAMTEAVDRVHTAGGTREEAEAAAAAESTAWQCAVDGHRAFGSTLAIYVHAVLDAQAGAGFSLDLVLPYVRRLAELARSTVSCVRAQGGDLPTLDFLDLIPPTWALGGAQ